MYKRDRFGNLVRNLFAKLICKRKLPEASQLKTHTYLLRFTKTPAIIKRAIMINNTKKNRPIFFAVCFSGKLSLSLTRLGIAIAVKNQQLLLIINHSKTKNVNRSR